MDMSLKKDIKKKPEVGQVWKWVSSSGDIITYDLITKTDNHIKWKTISPSIEKLDDMSLDSEGCESITLFMNDRTYVKAYNTPLYKLLNNIKDTKENE